MQNSDCNKERHISAVECTICHTLFLSSSYFIIVSYICEHAIGDSSTLLAITVYFAFLVRTFLNLMQPCLLLYRRFYVYMAHIAVRSCYCYYIWLLLLFWLLWLLLLLILLCFITVKLLLHYIYIRNAFYILMRQSKWM